MIKTIVHNVDGPDKGKKKKKKIDEGSRTQLTKLTKSTKGRNPIPKSGQILQRLKILQVYKVDGHR